MSSETLVGPSSLAAPGEEAASNVAGRKTRAKVAQWLLFLATAFAIVVLAALIWDIVASGGRWLSWNLLTNPPSRTPEKAGLRPGPVRHGLGDRA